MGIKKCIFSYRLAGKSSALKMGDLPVERIMASRPFSKVGINFVIPLMTKCHNKRKSSTFKSYICVFLRMLIKSVLLECISNLSIDVFLAALRRFVGVTSHQIFFF